MTSFTHRYRYRREIAFSSLFFALTDLDLWQAVGVFAAGLVRALVRLRPQSLVGAAWVHMANVLIGLSIGYWTFSMDSSGIEA